MRKISLDKNGRNQAIRLPKDREIQGVNELEIDRPGNTVVLKTSRPDWLSMAEYESADDDFPVDRENIVSDEGRVG